MLLMDKRHMIFSILIGIFLFGNLNSSSSGHQLKKYRYKQNLYKEYLYDWNYKNLFRKNFILTSHTGLLEIFLKVISFSLKIFPFRKKIINYFDYFSRYGFIINS